MCFCLKRQFTEAKWKPVMAGRRNPQLLFFCACLPPKDQVALSPVEMVLVMLGKHC